MIIKAMVYLTQTEREIQQKGLDVGRFTEDVFMWQWIGESCSTAGLTLYPAALVVPSGLPGLVLNPAALVVPSGRPVLVLYPASLVVPKGRPLLPDFPTPLLFFFASSGTCSVPFMPGIFPGVRRSPPRTSCL
ncbi:unnamed protein product [Menidia menidia]|uniref:(Atlantic silverside) hypothetical protein n=1 Tax=Menidia menidia TaxID=238744 RepID=A0A8S4ANI7_9TELE|nr:unnamed protein product [Menidia menidia]